MKNYFSDINRLFSPLEIIVLLGLQFAGHTWFFYFISGHLNIGIAVGAVSAVFFFTVFTVRSRKLKIYQDNLNALMKYVTNVTFLLRMGENVYQALNITKESLSGEVRVSVQEMIDTLEDDAVLITDHFDKYDFPAISQFHQNLKIKYTQGGDSKELFGAIQTNMMIELQKRDELYKKRKVFAMNVYMMDLMVVITALVLKMMVTNLWVIFLSYTLFSVIVLLITYVLIFLNLYLLQRKVSDISVHV